MWLLETSVTKENAHETSGITIPNEWEISPNKTAADTEFPLTKKQMARGSESFDQKYSGQLRILVQQSLLMSLFTQFQFSVSPSDQYMRIKGLKDLYQWQKECLKMKSVIQGGNLVFSLPTSAGKSLVAEVHLLNHLLKGNSVILVLPFVSIVQEKVAAMSQLARETGQKFVVEEYAAGNGRIPPIRRRETPALFIATIEKAAQLVACAISQKGPWLNCCVVDELHMIGEGWLMEIERILRIPFQYVLEKIVINIHRYPWSSTRIALIQIALCLRQKTARLSNNRNVS